MQLSLARTSARRIERCSRVFHVDGFQINKTKLHKAWRQARVAAGFPDLLIHDLRRSAVRNMRLAGISEVDAMKLSGHKNRHVFDRYSIVGDDDTRSASLRSDTYLSGKLKLDGNASAAPAFSDSLDPREDRARSSVGPRLDAEFGEALRVGCLETQNGNSG
jgi:hypothetical protein